MRSDSMFVRGGQRMPEICPAASKFGALHPQGIPDDMIDNFGRGIQEKKNCYGCVIRRILICSKRRSKYPPC